MKKHLHFNFIAFCMLMFSYSAYSQFQIINVQHVGHPIVIDGDFWEWDSATVHQIDILDLSGNLLPPMGSADFDPTFKAAWDADNFYFYFHMVDDTIFSSDSIVPPDTVGISTWLRDGMEIAIDGNANRNFNMFWSSIEDNSDMKLMVTADATKEDIAYPPQEYGNNLTHHNLSNFELAIANTEDGWSAEMLIPWTAIWSSLLAPPDSILMGLAANDSDTTGVRETIYRWSSDAGTSINTDASKFGRLVFSTIDTVPEPAPKPDPVSIISHNNNNTLNIWPNPTSGALNISSNSIINSIYVINVLGQNMNVINNIQTKQTNINVKSLQKGIYILEIKNNEGDVFIKKFYKQ